MPDPEENKLKINERLFYRLLKIVELIAYGLFAIAIAIIFNAIAGRFF